VARSGEATDASITERPRKGMSFSYLRLLGPSVSSCFPYPNSLSSSGCFEVAAREEELVQEHRRGRRVVASCSRRRHTMSDHASCSRRRHTMSGTTRQRPRRRAGGGEVHVLRAGADVLRVRARQLRLEVVHSLRSCATVDAAASATPAAAARSARWWLPSPPRKSSAARRGEWRRWRA
jgi:hypothetical protein